jgi:ferredoxin
MKVTVQEERCCGFAACLSIAPDVFDMDEQNVALVLTPEPDPAQYEGVRAAATACPTLAILVEE